MKLCMKLMKDITQINSQNSDVENMYKWLDIYHCEWKNNEIKPNQSLVGKTPAEIYWGREVARKAT